MCSSERLAGRLRHMTYMRSPRIRTALCEDDAGGGCELMMVAPYLRMCNPNPMLSFWYSNRPDLRHGVPRRSGVRRRGVVA